MQNKYCSVYKLLVHRPSLSTSDNQTLLGVQATGILWIGSGTKMANPYRSTVLLPQTMYEGNIQDTLISSVPQIHRMFRSLVGMDQILSSLRLLGSAYGIFIGIYYSVGLIEFNS